MATREERSFECLVDEALENVRADRDRILEAYEKMKAALDASDPEKTIMMSRSAAKLLEELTKCNQELVKLAQIKERQESKVNEKNKDLTPIDIDDIKSFVENQKKHN